MNKPSLLRGSLLAAAIAMGLAAGVDASAADIIHGPRHIPATAPSSVQRFIVKYRPGTAQARDRQQAALTLSAAAQRSVPGSARGGVPHMTSLRRTAQGADVVLAARPMSTAESERFLQQLKQDPSVQYAQVDRRMYALDTLPNDPQLPVYQWDTLNTLGGIHAPAAWDDSSGEGLVVAVLDTGVLQHVDLAANLVPGYDMVSSYGQDDDSPDIAVDGDGRDPDPTDPGDWSDGTLCSPSTSSWHGTHVAGTVAAVANNGKGIAGAAYGARVQPVRVLGRCGGFTSDIADAIVWASGGQVEDVPDNATPAEVINLSLGGQGACSEEPALQEAIDAARGRGTTIVVAAGNSSSDAALFSPASCTGVIAVGATGFTGAKASYSNYGSIVALAGPGGDIDRSIPVSRGAIWSTGDGGSTVANGDNVLVGLTGTSMASPHVAAVAALVQSAAVKAGQDPLTPDQVRDVLVRSVRPFTVQPPADQPLGAGLVDAYRAVQLAMGKPLPELPKPTLENNTLLSGQAGAAGQSRLYVFDVPAGTTSLNLRSLGGTGNVSLYASAGIEPSVENAQYRSIRPGNAEAIVVSRPQPGTWYLRVVGESDFSNVSLLGIAR
ncbi:S8 family peptidase [Xanthomonas sp. 60]